MCLPIQRCTCAWSRSEQPDEIAARTVSPGPLKVTVTEAILALPGKQPLACGAKIESLDSANL
jgi:hypothetical protein